MNNAINKGFFIKFHACVFKLHFFKKSREFFRQFLGNVTIDINGKVSFSKFRCSLNSCISKVGSRNFTK